MFKKIILSLIFGSMLLVMTPAMAQTNNLSFQNPIVFDTVTGNPVSTINVGQQVQIGVDLANNQTTEQSFAYVVRIVSIPTNVQVSYQWIEGSLSFGQSFSPSLTWEPTSCGDYVASLIVFDNMTDANLQASPLSLSLTVAGCLPVSSSCGSTNPNLYVSSEDTSNTFSGATVNKVVICDSDIADTTQAKGEPDVTVNGRILRMIQATDGHWYGYFADKTQAQQADSTVITAGTGSDFGVFCSKDTNSSVFGVDFSDTAGFTVPRSGGVYGYTNGNDPMNLCTGPLAISANLNNVVTDAPSMNMNFGIPHGQIGVAPDMWPIIQLYDFTLDSNVIVQYNKGGGAQSSTIAFTSTTPMIISSPADITKYISSSSEVVTYPQVTAIDGMDGIIIGTCTPNSGSVFSLGTTIVTCTVTNSSGDVATTTFDVNLTSLFVDKFGTKGYTNTQFKYPQDVTTNSDHKIIVADSARNRIPIFNSDGTYAGRLGDGTFGTTSGFSYPMGITTDSNGRIIVADTFHSRISIFNSDGTYADELGDGTRGSGNNQFKSPMRITTDSNGRIIVADTFNNRISIFNSDGTYAGRLGDGTFGTTSGFLGPQDVATDSNDRIIVADTAHHRIQIFESDGTFVGKFGTHGSGNGKFNYPVGITTDSDDRIIVSDVSNHRIQIFESDGTFVGKFGTHGSGNGQFHNPHGLTTDSNDRIIVADTSNSRIQIFNTIPSPVFVDSDNDGISDSIDRTGITDESIISSTNFEDTNSPQTTGQIISNSPTLLQIKDHDDPAKGVIITAKPAMSSTSQVSVCDGIATLDITSGDSLVVTCGSATLDVISGSVDAVFVSGNSKGTTTLEYGTSLTFHPESFEFVAGDGNVQDVTVNVDGQRRIIPATASEDELREESDDILAITTWDLDLIEWDDDYGILMDGILMDGNVIALGSYGDYPVMSKIIPLDDDPKLSSFLDELEKTQDRRHNLETSDDYMTKQFFGLTANDPNYSIIVDIDDAKDTEYAKALFDADSEMDRRLDDSDKRRRALTDSIMTIKLDVADPIHEFGIREGGRTVGAGQVTEIVETSVIPYGDDMFIFAIDVDRRQALALEFISVPVGTIKHVEDLLEDETKKIIFHLVMKVNRIDMAIVSPDDSDGHELTHVAQKVPSWVQQNAKWWAEGQVSEDEFVSGIQHLIKEKIIDIPDLPKVSSDDSPQEMPSWIKKNAGWWADGLVSEGEFVNGLKYMIEKGIIKIIIVGQP